MNESIGVVFCHRGVMSSCHKVSPLIFTKARNLSQWNSRTKTQNPQEYIAGRQRRFCMLINPVMFEFPWKRVRRLQRAPEETGGSFFFSFLVTRHILLKDSTQDRSKGALCTGTDPPASGGAGCWKHFHNNVENGRHVIRRLWRLKQMEALRSPMAAENSTDLSPLL